MVTQSQFYGYVIEGRRAHLQEGACQCSRIGKALFILVADPRMADGEMLHTAAGYPTRVLLLLDAERQKNQNAERFKTVSRGRLSQHSSLVASARLSLQFDMRNVNETGLRSLMSGVAGRIRHCGTVYHSDWDTPLGTYKSALQQGVHSILESLYHSLEALCSDEAPEDPQWHSISLPIAPSQYTML